MLIDKIQERVKHLLYANNYFKNIITIVIIVAGILAGIQTDSYLNEKYNSLFHIIDMVIISIFIFEMFIYMLDHGRRPWRYFNDAWHIFDFSIIVISLIPLFFPSSNTEFVVVFRLARILRLARLFEKIKKLKFILNTLFRILPSMGYVVVLLILLFYVYGVISTDLFGKIVTEEFGTLWSSMRTLFFISFDGWSDLYESDSVQILFANGFPEWIFILIFISFQFVAALIFLNLFIGIITSEMESVREDENRGKSKIYTTGHTLILGWNDEIFNIISELRKANNSKEKAEIVILADKSKKEMDYLIQENFEGFSTTKVRTRSGNPSHIDDLQLVNAWKSKSIILLNSPEIENYDYTILKSIIALLNGSDNSSNLPFHIVAEVTNPSIQQIIKTIDLSGILIIFDTDNFLSILISQSMLNPNISKVYHEILGFSGNEFYIQSIMPEQIGLTYKDMIYKYDDSCLVGYMNDNECVLNPKSDYIFQNHDKLIILAEDDSSIKYKPNIRTIIDLKNIIESNNQTNINKNIVFLAYNHKLPSIIYNHNMYLHHQSNLKILLSDTKEIKEVLVGLQGFFKDFTCIDELNYKFGFCSLEFFIKEHIDYDFLLTILKGNETVVVLADTRNYTSVDEVDTNTLVKLLLLKEMEKKSNIEVTIIAEILDNNNREIVKNKYISDFIIGANIIGPILSQLSEDKNMDTVFKALFTYKGAEIYSRSALNYIKTNIKTNFAAIVESALKKNETAIGIMRENSKILQRELILNPKKSREIILSEEDKIIVLANEDV